MEKSCGKYASKASPRFLFNFACEKFLQKYVILKEDYQQHFNFIQSLLTDKTMKNKRGLELVNSRSSGYKTSSEKILYQ